MLNIVSKIIIFYCFCNLTIFHCIGGTDSSIIIDPVNPTDPTDPDNNTPIKTPDSAFNNPTLPPWAGAVSL